MEKKLSFKTKRILYKRKEIITKGSLIKGMSKKLPSDILENPVFRKRLKEIMKGYSGIYALKK